MFAKNLKHEMKATARVLVPLLACVLILGIVLGLVFGGIGSLANMGDDNDIESGEVPGAPGETDGIGDEGEISTTADIIAFIIAVIFVILVIGFFVMMCVCAVAVFVLMVRRFYTSFFTDEGYLTFTLPVTVDCHIITKTVSMIIWTVISDVVIFVGLAAFFFGIYTMAPENFMMDEYEKLILEAILDQLFDMYSGSIAFAVISAIVSNISSYLLLFFSISVGCMLTKKHRFITCAASYLIINGVVSQIITTLMGVISYSFSNMEFDKSTADLYGMTILLISTLLYIAQGVGCYFGTRWILKNKINLD